jgi:hypothetical protein
MKRVEGQAVSLSPIAAEYQVWHICLARWVAGEVVITEKAGLGVRLHLLLNQVQQLI